MPDPISSTIIMPASPVNDLLGGVPAPAKPVSKGFDKDMFLQLLVAQMRYQNPLKPMDQSEFMAQAAQLASVEALQQMQASQADQAHGQRALAAATLAGRHVTGLAADGTQVSGTVEKVLVMDDGIDLVVDGVRLPMDQVRSIEAPQT